MQNADCDDEADFAFCIFCDDEADMQIGPGHNVGRCEEARGEVVKEGF